MKKFFLFLALLTFGVGQMWGEELITYTLQPASGSNNSYAGNCDVAISSITWNITGNSTQQPWRLGGKSITNTDRAVYSKTAISDNISKIVITHGEASSITINSMTVIVSKNSDFSSPSTLTPTFAASSTVTVNRPAGEDWSNCYYKINYNVTVSGDKNKFLEFTKAEFYKEVSCNPLAAPGSPSSTPHAESVDLSWNSVSGATGYLVTFNGTEYNIASGTTTKTISGLSMETEYHWTVAAKGDGTTNCAVGTATAEQTVTTLDDCTGTKVTYSVTSTSAVSVSGTAPTGATATYSSTYSSKCQLTSGKSMTLTLSGYKGYIIKSIKLSMKSNTGGGSGNFSAVAGTTTISSISTAAFNSASWNGAYTTSYVTIVPTMSNDGYTIKKDEDVVITIAATANSLYCESFSICYEEGCTSLGSINGSVSLSQLDPAEEGKLKAEWTLDAVTGIGSLQMELWKKGAIPEQDTKVVNAESVTISTSKQTKTYTGLDNCETYYAKLIATKDAGTYCTNGWTEQSNDAATLGYAITLTGGGTVTEQGTFSADPTHACAGATVTLSATPEDDYNFDEWSVTKTSGGAAVSMATANTFVMPDEAVTVAATFKAKSVPLAINLTANDHVTISTDQTNNEAVTGTTVTLSYSDLTSGYAFVGWIVKDGTNADVTVTNNTFTMPATAVTVSANVRQVRTVTWYKADNIALTDEELGEATTSVYDGDAVTVLPNGTALSPCDPAISFQGWTNATYAKSDDAPTVLFTDAEDAPEISGGNASYYAVWANGGLKSDVLTRETTGVTNGSTTYSDWSNKTLTSTAVYAGNSAGGNDAIQLRSNNSNSGVITTTSGGKATKVSVVWQSDTQAGRTLNVYGKNSAYSAASDLYATATQGTLIGTIVKGTSTELTIEDDYEYIGVCSASGAMYLTSLTVQWNKVSDYATTCSAPVVIADPTFSPAAGTYDNDQTVEISAGQGMTIKYSIGADSDPKTNGTTYSNAISVTEDKVIKAVATDGNGNWSNVVTKTYTINYSSSIAAFIEKAQNMTRYLRLNAAQNCVVTAVKKNYQDKVTNIYCQDNSGAGIIIYNGAGFGDNEINVGDRIVGAVSGTWSPYLMQPEMGSAVFADGVTFTSVSRPDAPTVTVANVNSGDAYTAHPMMLVTVENLYYKSVNGSTYTFNTQNDGNGTDVTIYDNFSYLSGKTMPGVACTIVGIMARNNNNYQILPVELTTAATAALPTISPEGGADAEHAVEVTYLSAVSVPLVENEDIYVSVNDAAATKLTEDASITIENDTKIAVTAKRDFYADNTVTYFYKPSAYPQNIGVTSEHGEVVVKVGETTVSTALPGATVTFTVTSENEHFHIASTSVTYEGGSLTPSLNENVYSFEMPDKDATIVVNYTEDAKYSITFNGGGAEGEGPAAFEDQYAGTEITLPTKEEANYTAPTDKVFNGWVVTSGEDEVEQNNGKFDMPAGNVTIEAQWADRVYCALTLNINGSTSTTNIDREVRYVLPTEEDEISGYTFYGWAEAPEAKDVEAAIDTIKSFIPDANEASKTLYAVFKRTVTGANKTDVLTYADFNATGTGYAVFSDVQKNSNAKYAGNTALNNNVNIQINKKAENGIYSSASGGTLVSVTIAMSSSSDALGIYGNNTAFTGYTNIPTQSGSTEIGTLASETSKTITPSSDYKYVGIASKANGVKYIQSITIVWQPKTTYYTTAPAAVYDVTYALGTEPNGTWKANEGCDNAKVKTGQTYTICEDEPVRDHNKFNGWDVYKTGTNPHEAVSVADNQFTMPAAAVTVSAVWVAKVESNVTYNAGTGTGDDVVVSNVEEGTEVTLKAIGSGEGQADFTKSGYDFKGWKYNGKTYKAGATIEMPAEAITLTAQWKKQNVEKLSLIKDASQLMNGMNVVIANQEAGTVAGASEAESNSFLASETGIFNTDKSQITNIGNGIKMTLTQLESGWALKYNNKYLKEYSGNKICWVNDPIAWQITVGSDSTKIERTVGNNSYAIRFNSANNAQRFAAYGLSSVHPIQLYGELTVVSGTTNISDYGYVEGDVIVLSENAELTVDADIAPTTMIVPAGTTVTVNDNKQIDANTLIVERGGTLDIQTNGTVNTDETFVIYSTLGKGNGGTSSGNAPGSSSQIKNANKINATGDVFFELELTQETKASAGWYAFSVPFPVDAMTGVYYGNTQLQNEVGYAIMSYHGDKRAAGEYAWKKYRDIMAPGVLYIIAVGDTDYKTLRFKKHGNDAFSTSTGVAVKQYSSDIDGAYAGWNGIGNPSMQVSYLPATENVYYMQFLDHANNRFQIRQRSNINLVVGSAFFIQYRAADGQIAINTGLQDGASGYLAPTRERSAVEESIYEISLFNTATNEVEDNVFITAREEATNSYEIGRDVAKMIMGTAKCAQMSIQAYGKQLGAADFPLVNGQAAYPLTITAPAAGTYTISTEAQDNADIYLTQDGAIIWNLSMGEYELNLTQGTMNDYGLLLIEKTPGIATGVDEISGEKAGVQKIVIEDKVFILRGGKMYDVTGKAVK